MLLIMKMYELILKENLYMYRKTLFEANYKTCKIKLYIIYVTLNKLTFKENIIFNTLKPQAQLHFWACICFLHFIK